MRRPSTAHPALAYTLDVPKACEDADLVLHLTRWPEYGRIDPAGLAAVVHEPLLLDARGGLDEPSWRAAGWSVHALGRPDRSAAVSARGGAS
ncbi:hypothetical protein [Streptomyces sp. NPDC005568]|uniref:hypothetical protein n=1 Tax=Streptomyces sp. NPDC005568 TaxID=3156887 RepID=UPI0033B5EA21